MLHRESVVRTEISFRRNLSLVHLFSLLSTLTFIDLWIIRSGDRHKLNLCGEDWGQAERPALTFFFRCTFKNTRNARRDGNVRKILPRKMCSVFFMLHVGKVNTMRRIMLLSTSLTYHVVFLRNKMLLLNMVRSAYVKFNLSNKLFMH